MFVNKCCSPTSLPQFQQPMQTDCETYGNNLSYRGSSDGQHTVYPGTDKEAKVFCDMTGALTGCKGGGWTLVMRIDGQQVFMNRN